MTISMYQASIPVFIFELENLLKILDKGAAFAESKKIDPLILTSARLAPDMFPLSRQIQIATDGVKGCAARLSGTDNPVFEDTETTFPELRERIEKTIAFIKTVTPAQIDGTEGKAILVKGRTRDRNFNGLDYLMRYVIPNFYFHATTAYAILRHNGVEVGKNDFLGPVG